jgi:hypothetical protein
MAGSAARMKWIVILLILIVAGAVGSYWYDGYSAQSALLKQPVYRVLKKHEPAVFATLVEEYKDMVATAKRLQKAPGDACFRYWFPQVSGPPDVAKYIDEQSQAHTLDLMGEVIRSAAEDPVELPAAEEVKDNLANVINATYEEYGVDAQMIAHAGEPGVDRARICTITISVYDRILRLPPADSSALLRAMTQMR